MEKKSLEIRRKEKVTFNTHLYSPKFPELPFNGMVPLVVVLNVDIGVIPEMFFPKVFSCKSWTHASRLALLKEGDCAMTFGFVDVDKL